MVRSDYDLYRDWETVVRRCHLHRMYKSLKSVNERKEIYNRYIADMKEKEAVCGWLI